MDEITFTVPDISCAHCEQAITTEVGKVAGVATVAVDLAGKRVTVSGTSLDRDAVVAAIDEAGYDVAD